MENEDNEKIEHIVEVDDYIEVRIQIPKKITAMELKGLMSKADKLFKLSDTEIFPKKTVKTEKPAKKLGRPVGSKAGKKKGRNT